MTSKRHYEYRSPKVMFIAESVILKNNRVNGYEFKTQKKEKRPTVD